MTKYLHIFLLLVGVYSYSQVITDIKVKDAAGNENFHVTCTNDLDANGCIPLHVEFPVLKQTNTYQVTQGTYDPAIPLNQGTSLNANFDDVFTSKIDLPFKFCFFNQYFESVVIGSNGMVTFDLNQQGNINYPNIIWQNPDPGLPKNSIFGVYHDMVFSAGDSSEIYYSTVGTAPNRKFVINFYDGRVAGCTDRSSSQIVLHETTNIVEVFVDKKLTPCATRKFENSLIGIINDDGTVGYSPASRNTGNWQALQESWKFTPNGNIIQPTVTWTNSAGQTVGTGIQTTVCPTQNEVYTANVNFNICGNSNLALTDDFILDFDSTYPISRNYTQDFCGNAPVQLNLNDFKPNVTSQNPANFNFTFHNSLADAQNNQNSISTNYSLNANTVLYVRIQNPNVPGCFRVAVLTLNFLTKNLLIDTVSVCDTNNDGVEPAYDLTLLNNQFFPAGGTNIAYFLSQSNAQNNTNAVTAPNITPTTKVWARVQYGSCTYVLGPISFAFKPGVNVNSPISFPYTMCDINADNKEPFDFALNLGPLISPQGGVSFSAYESYAAAYNQSGPVLEQIKKGIYTIFIRVQIPGGCFTVVPVNMNITFTEILANDKNEYICFNGTEDVTVNLSALSANMLTSPLTVPFTKFYEIFDDAMEDQNPISPTQIITENGSLVTKTFYVRFEESEDCYTVRAINVYLVHPVIVSSNFNICDFNNDNTENIDLTQFSGAIIGNQNATTTFYLTQAEAQSGNNAVTTVNLVGTKQYFVKINSYNCTQIYPITVSLVLTPAVNSVVNISLTNICDNNNDGVELYNLLLAQPQIYNGSAGVMFTYYTSYNPTTHAFSGQITNPGEFPVQGNATVYVKIKFNNSECFSASQVNIQMTFLPTVVLINNAVLNACDEEFNLNETFVLSDAVSQMFVASQNTYQLSDMNISYYNTLAEANAGNPSNQIGSSIVTTVSSVQVWARFQSKTTGCFSVAPIQLNTYFPPKAINSSIIICDDNLDGIYEVNLMNYTNLYVDIPNAINTFTFYLTQNDAQNGTNPIANPQNFTANPFPQQIWVKVMNIPGCDDIATINFIIGNKIVLQNSGPFLLNNVCDTLNDGIEIVNLTQFQPQIYSGNNVAFTYYPSLADLNSGTNAITNPANYSFNQNGGSDTIYVKVIVPGLCPEVATIKISLKQVPFFEIPTQFFCPDATFSYTLKVEGHTIVSYVWTNPAGQIVSNTDTLVNAGVVGTYTVTVTSDNGCSYTATFEAKHYDVPVIQNMVANGSTYTITATGSQPIIYSIDGITWQSSNVFYNLPTGITTFYVKYVEGKCIVKQDGVILDIKNTITPNGDGFNDKWIIRNLHVFGTKMTNVKVFDRYQYLIFEQNTNTQIVWNGTIAGRPIPTSSYWYVITLPDGRTFTGWILVKNNN
ncbi:T9SS type B sorting domain-containing protein [Chryseobacterium luquanense]|uniref:T9SS type B sorting domain-containing protein n=1 Tax=Chryseobacterium luquanense TaxID=2983766 RepID=A0ABT3Y732_9FLAO|nr:T9SS type B sorting domain-containing protein [Chryseobacterium luquanense]MCX8533970.1 T9SS type B sorting domain-containing protein [Chryseobacterium luquanense]